MKRRRPLALTILALIIGIALTLTQRDDRRTPYQPPATTTSVAPRAELPAPASIEEKPSPVETSGLILEDVKEDERAEVARVASLIDAGGPYPYKKDGTTFRNAERRLPAKDSRYYREFTVPTPRVKTRGARRIVAGEAGELYYTNDHYRTFVKIRAPMRPSSQ